MKKAIALLLALALVGGAVFAQELEIAAGGFGNVQVFNDGTDTFLDSNAGFYADFDYAGEVYGFSAELEWDAYDVGTSTNDTENGAPYFNYAYGYAKLLDGMVKVNVGNMWMTGYRFRNSMLNVLGGAAISGDGAAIEVMPIEGLSAALVVPAAGMRSLVTGANSKTLLLSDAFKEIDVLAKYAMADVGTFYTSYQMTADDTVGSKFNIAANLSAFGPAVTAQFGYEASKIGHATDDVLSKVFLAGGYKLSDALSVLEEVNLTLDTDLLWLSQTYVAYRPADIRFSGTLRLWNSVPAVGDAYINVRVTPAARFYSGANYWNIGFQYDMTTASGSKATWGIPINYSIDI